MQFGRLSSWVALVTVFFISNVALGAPTIQINSFAVEREPHVWRFIFNASGPVQYQQFSLSKPPRIVLDIERARLQGSFSAGLLANTPVSHLRVGYPKSGVVRLVFDLDYDVRVTAQALAATRGHGYQLQLTLSGNKPKVIGFDWPQRSSAKPDIAMKKLPAPEAEMTAEPYLSDAVATTRFARPVIVVIDPGHGGKDPGAIGRRGTREKNVVLALAQEIQKRIEQQRGFRAVLTRQADYYIPLRQRLAIARRYKADMFISVHADAYRDRYARGASIYALSQRGATNEASRWLAQRENESELMGGLDLSDKNNMLRSVLINLSQTASIRASLQVGQDIIRFIGQFGVLHYTRVGQAAFVVLKSPDVPSILMESGFISNPSEEQKLSSNEYRRQLANAVTYGVNDYFTKNPPRGTWLAMQQASLRGSR